MCFPRFTPRIIKSIIRLVDIWAIDQVDAVILADEKRREQIARAKPARIEVIYNTPVDNQGHKGIRSGKPGTFSIVYVGLLQVEHGLKELIEVIKRHPDWALNLAGFGGDEDLLRSLAEGAENVTWNGRISHEKALDLSADADVLIATYDPKLPNHRYSSPNKIFEAMMLAKPIIVAEATNADEIVRKWDMGLVVRYGNLADLNNALETIHRDEELRKKMRKNARRAYENQYSWTKMQQRLISLYQSVITKH